MPFYYYLLLFFMQKECNVFGFVTFNYLCYLFLFIVKKQENTISCVKMKTGNILWHTLINKEDSIYKHILFWLCF